MSPLRSGFISAHKRNFIFASSGQGCVAFEGIPSYWQKKSLGGTHTAGFKSSHSGHILPEHVGGGMRVCIRRVAYDTGRLYYQKSDNDLRMPVEKLIKVRCSGNGTELELQLSATKLLLPHFFFFLSFCVHVCACEHACWAMWSSRCMEDRRQHRWLCFVTL